MQVATGDGEVEVSVVMPCLDEAETLATCIGKAAEGIRALGLRAEIVIADNGSHDGSQAIAEQLGARVVDVATRGYGSALQGGIEAARGRFVVMGDADDSYDFSAIGPFVEKLREGYDLVMGDRLGGRIQPGAMPWLHRWVGNPLLSFVGRVFFRSPVRDFHCGLRAFTRDAYFRLRLRTTGMEFASEMVIRASLLGMRITEVPVVLYPDGRTRRPHLRRWRDGWRHLRFMLLFSPRWLFLTPGLVLLGVGAALSVWLVGGSRQVGPIALDIHTLLVGGFLCILGYQLIVFAAFTKIFALREGFHPSSPTLNRVFRYLTLEVGLAIGLLMTLGGLAALGLAVWTWQGTGFGKLDPRVTMREAIPSVVLLSLGLQTIFASFFLSILGMGLRGRPAWDGREAEVELL